MGRLQVFACLFLPLVVLLVARLHAASAEETSPVLRLEDGAYVSTPVVTPRVGNVTIDFWYQPDMNMTRDGHGMLWYDAPSQSWCAHQVAAGDHWLSCRWPLAEAPLELVQVPVNGTNTTIPTLKAVDRDASPLLHVQMPADNAWAHVALVYRESDVLELYVNAELRAATNHTRVPATVAWGSFSLSAPPHAVNLTVPGQPVRLVDAAFTGRITEYRVWARPLELPELMLVYRGRATGVESDMFVYYPLQGDLRDTSPAGFDGSAQMPGGPGTLTFPTARDSPIEGQVVTNMPMTFSMNITLVGSQEDDPTVVIEHMVANVDTHQSVFEPDEQPLVVEYVSITSPELFTQLPRINMTSHELVYETVEDGHGESDITFYVTEAEPDVRTKVFQFDGSSRYVSVPASASWDLTSQVISIEAWARGTGPLLSRGENSPTSDVFWDFEVAEDFLILKTAGSQHFFNNTRPFDEDAWVHYAVTVGGGVVNAYAQGVFMGSSALTEPLNNITSTAPVRIGMYTENSFTEFWDGQMDEVLVWRRVLAIEEIQRRARTYFQRRDEFTSLVAWWQFDESLWGVLDASPVGTNHGMAVGSSPRFGYDERIWPQPSRTDLYAFRVEVTPVNDLPSFVRSEVELRVPWLSGAHSFDAWAIDTSPGPTNELNQELVFTITIASATTPGLFATMPTINATSGTLRVEVSASPLFGGALLDVEMSDSGLLDTTVALLLDNTGSAYVSVPTHAAFESLTKLVPALTLEVWAYVPSVVRRLTLLMRGDGAGDTQFDMYIAPGSGGGMVLWVEFGAEAHESTLQLDVEQWHHLAVALDDATVTFYIDGEAHGTSTRTVPLAAVATPLFIGNRGSVCLCDRYEGMIDEALVWAYARDPADIATAASQPRVFTTFTPGLLGWWRFDDAESLLITDYSGNGHEGTLVRTAVPPSSEVADWYDEHEWRVPASVSKQLFMHVDGPPLGDALNPAESCFAIAHANVEAESGWYVLRPPINDANMTVNGTVVVRSEVLVDAFCDMETDGGGWTLGARFGHHDTDLGAVDLFRVEQNRTANVTNVAVGMYNFLLDDAHEFRLTCDVVNVTTPHERSMFLRRIQPGVDAVFAAGGVMSNLTTKHVECAPDHLYRGQHVGSENDCIARDDANVTMFTYPNSDTDGTGEYAMQWGLSTSEPSTLFSCEARPEHPHGHLSPGAVWFRDAVPSQPAQLPSIVEIQHDKIIFEVQGTLESNSKYRVDYYVAEWSDNSFVGQPLGTSIVNAPSFLLPDAKRTGEVADLQPQTRYQLRVRARTGVAGVASPILVDISTAPGSPSQASYVRASIDSLTVSWSDPEAGSPPGDEVSNYFVEWSTDNFVDDVQIASTGFGASTKRDALAVQSYTITDLEMMTSYRVRVRGTNGYPGAYSFVSDALSTAPAFPATPTQTNSTTDESIALKWGAPQQGTPPGAPVVLYEVQWVRADLNFDNTTHPSFGTIAVVEREYTIDSIINSTATMFRVRVRASNGDEVGPFSSTAYLSTSPVPPPNIRSSAANQTSIVVTWDEPALGTPPGFPVTHYTVEWSSSADFANAQSRRVATTSLLVGGFAENTPFYFRVRSEMSSTVVSTMSVPVELWTTPLVPTNLRLVHSTPYSVDLAWDAPPDAAGVSNYRIEFVTPHFETTEGLVSGLVDVAEKVEHGTVPALVPDTTYTVRVRAGSPFFSNHSTEVDVTTTPGPPHALYPMCARDTFFAVNWTNYVTPGYRQGQDVFSEYEMHFSKLPDFSELSVSYTLSRIDSEGFPRRTEHNVFGFEASTRYFARIRANSHLGHGAWSNVSEIANFYCEPRATFNLTCVQNNYTAAYSLPPSSVCEAALCPTTHVCAPTANCTYVSCESELQQCDAVQCTEGACVNTPLAVAGCAGETQDCFPLHTCDDPDFGCPPGFEIRNITRLEEVQIGNTTLTELVNVTRAECIACDRGTFKAEFGNNGRCLPCAPGSFVNVTGASECELCPAGYFNDREGVADGYTDPVRLTFAQCFPCFPGESSSEGASECIACPPGSYQPLPASPECEACGPGQFNTFTGAINGTLNNVTGEFEVCFPCPRGTYQPLNVSGVCVLCELGEFGNDTGLASCPKCPVAQHQALRGQFNCTECDVGRYADVEGLASCKRCEPGTFNPFKHQRVCQPCPAGQDAQTSGRTECTDCERGRYANTTGVAVCEPCPYGSYNNATRSSQCTKCPPGMFASELGSLGCSPCSAGAFSLGSAANCTLCPPGTVQNTTAQSTCTLCPAGRFQNASGQLECRVCRPGSFAGQGAPECLPCGLGTATSLFEQSECQPCEHGRHAPTVGRTECLDCAPGSVAPDEGQSECDVCDVGHAQPSFAGTSCLPCERGSTANETGQALCDLCKPGTFVDAEAQVSCLPCGIHEFQDDFGQTECKPCPYGTVTDVEGASQCRPMVCFPGFHQAGKNTTYHAVDVSMLLSDYLARHPDATVASVGDDAWWTTPEAIGLSPSLGASVLAINTTRLEERNVTICNPCRAGFFAEVHDQLTCDPCSSGYFANYTGSTQCSICPPGRVNLEVGRPTCDLCKVNHYQPLAGQKECIECPEGSFQDLEGRSDCICERGWVSNTTVIHHFCDLCVPGTYTNQTNSMACVSCDPGWYQPDAGALGCIACAVGRYQGEPGATTCPRCAPGSVQPDMGQHECLSCNETSYQDLHGQTECVVCPANSATRVRGADSVEDCLCNAGFFSLELRTGTPCVPCVRGAVCDGGDAQPYAERGWWTSGDQDFVFTECPFDDACPGGPSFSCNDGFSGKYCGDCGEGYSFFSRSCEKCMGGAGSSMLFMFGFFGLCGLFLSMYWLGQSSVFTNTIVIAIHSFQVVALFRDYALDWPYYSVLLLKVLSFFNWNIEFLMPECVASSLTYYHVWGFYMMLPFFFAGFWFLIVSILKQAVWREVHGVTVGLHMHTPQWFRDIVHKLSHKKAWRKFIDRVISAGLAFLSMAYLTLLQRSVEVFDCTELDRNTPFSASRVLVFDARRSIVCYSAFHAAIVPFGVLGMIGYGLGIPYLFYRVTVMQSERLEDSVHRRRYGFAYSRYEFDYYWYELTVFLRKFTIVFINVFSTTVTIFQASLSLMVLFVSLGFQAYTRPYVFSVNDRLDFSLLMSSFLMLLGGFVFFVDRFPSENGKEAVGVVVVVVVMSAFLWSCGVLVYDLLLFRSEVAKSRYYDEEEKAIRHFHLPLAKEFPRVFQWLDTAGIAERHLIANLVHVLHSTQRLPRRHQYEHYNRVLLTHPFGIAWLLQASPEEKKRFVQYCDMMYTFSEQHRFPPPLDKIFRGRQVSIPPPPTLEEILATGSHIKQSTHVEEHHMEDMFETDEVMDGLHKELNVLKHQCRDLKLQNMQIMDDVESYKLQFQAIGEEEMWWSLIDKTNNVDSDDEGAGGAGGSTARSLRTPRKHRSERSLLRAAVAEDEEDEDDLAGRFVARRKPPRVSMLSGDAGIAFEHQRLEKYVRELEDTFVRAEKKLVYWERKQDELDVQVAEMAEDLYGEDVSALLPVSDDLDALARERRTAFEQLAATAAMKSVKRRDAEARRDIVASTVSDLRHELAKLKAAQRHASSSSSSDDGGGGGGVEMTPLLVRGGGGGSGSTRTRTGGGRVGQSSSSSGEDDGESSQRDDHGGVGYDGISSDEEEAAAAAESSSDYSSGDDEAVVRRPIQLDLPVYNPRHAVQIASLRTSPRGDPSERGEAAEPPPAEVFFKQASEVPPGMSFIRARREEEEEKLRKVREEAERMEREAREAEEAVERERVEHEERVRSDSIISALGGKAPSLSDVGVAPAHGEVAAAGAPREEGDAWAPPRPRESGGARGGAEEWHQRESWREPPREEESWREEPPREEESWRGEPRREEQSWRGEPRREAQQQQREEPRRESWHEPQRRDSWREPQSVQQQQGPRRESWREPQSVQQQREEPRRESWHEPQRRESWREPPQQSQPRAPVDSWQQDYAQPHAHGHATQDYAQPHAHGHATQDYAQPHAHGHHAMQDDDWRMSWRQPSHTSAVPTPSAAQQPRDAEDDWRQAWRQPQSPQREDWESFE